MAAFFASMRKARGRLRRRHQALTGRFKASPGGFGFVLVEDGRDVLIPAIYVRGALDGDLVEYEILREGGDRGPVGYVVSVIRRATSRFTGIVEGSRKRRFIVPDSPKMPERIRLVGPRSSMPKGERVVAEVVEQPGGRSARVISRLGEADDPAHDNSIVATELGLPGEYPAEAEAEVAEAEARLRRPDGRRADLTCEPVITIDPAEAHDFDDAISLSKSRNGQWLLRVHIADVAEAVPLGSALDLEARRRGNSFYLPGSVIPMLPKRLSSGVLSLLPGEPRKTVTVSILLDDAGTLHGYRIDHTVVRSRARLTYEEVQAFLEGRSRMEGELGPMLQKMDQIAQALRRRRFEHGALDIDVPEPRAVVDSRGAVLGLERREQTRSHQLIEEFMILANRAACSFARRRGLPYIFRVHDIPDLVALESFLEEASEIVPRRVRLESVGAVVRWVASVEAGPAIRRLLHYLFLRAMKHARYDPVDIGHFGLGLRGYAHFTSPIRRYADLHNHRIVKWALRRGRRPAPLALEEPIEEIARICTEQEQVAEEAERAAFRLKAIRWAAKHLGESFRATVTGVIRSGFFVELDDVPLEGFVPASEVWTLPYLVAELRRSKRRGALPLGMPVVVQIVRASIRERWVAMTLRAAGRRALLVDPRRMEPLSTDPDVGRRSRGKRPRRRR